MPLSADPSVTYNAQGNILAAGTSIGAGNSTGGNTVDVSANSLGTWLAVVAVGGATVNTTNGCQVLIYPAGDNTPHYDTVALTPYTVPIAVNTTNQETIQLPTGKFNVVLKNLDPANAITAGITSNPIA